MSVAPDTSLPVAFDAVLFRKKLSELTYNNGPLISQLNASALNNAELAAQITRDIAQHILVGYSLIFRSVSERFPCKPFWVPAYYPCFREICIRFTCSTCSRKDYLQTCLSLITEYSCRYSSLLHLSSRFPSQKRQVPTGASSRESFAFLPFDHFLRSMLSKPPIA